MPTVKIIQPSLILPSLKLHMVHFNTKYGEDFDEAMEVGNGAQDTLSVLAIMFRITEEDNYKLQPLIESKKCKYM